MLYRNLAKPVLFQIDPEKAHHITVDGLGAASRVPGMTALLHSMYGVASRPETTVSLCGLMFPNPVGLAAGLDKNAKAVGGFSSLGFGFMEVGTVTPNTHEARQIAGAGVRPPRSAELGHTAAPYASMR